MSRYSFPSDEDQQPITWLGGQAIYGAHFIVVVFVASLIATSLLLTFGGSTFLGWLEFNSTDVLKGQVWRVLTYGLVNPPSLWFVVGMLMIVWYGRELEKFFGRRTFFILYGALYLITPLLFTVLGLRWPLSLAGVPGAIAIFTAFATLYPNAGLIFGILAKWAAAIFIGLYALIDLSEHNWPALIALGVTTGFAHLFVRYSQGHFALPTLPSLKSSKRQKEQVAAPRAKPVPAPKEAALAEIDILLDRIAKSGLASLTPKERARLDAARENLIKQPRR